MKNLVSAVIILLLVSCASSPAAVYFVDFNPVDKTTSLQLVKAERLANNKSVFNLYLVNGELLAITAPEARQRVFTSPGVYMFDIAGSVTLNRDQVNELIAALVAIQSEYSDFASTPNKAALVDFSIRGKEGVDGGVSSVFTLAGDAGSTAKEGGERILLRFQFVIDRFGSWAQTKRILYYLRGSAGTLTIDEVKKFTDELRTF